MVRPPSLLPALAAVVITVTAPLLTAPSSASSRPAPARNDAPLSVSIDDLAPSVVPRSGPVRMSGSVTNTDDETWYGINVHAFISGQPITTLSDLEATTDVAPGAPTGERITAPGTFDTISSLEPGESAQFSVRVPRRDLEVTLPGVYWFGAHAIGEGPEPRDSTADGRARTFLPLVPEARRRPVDTALVVPVRHHVDHAPDGSLVDLGRWAATFGSEGRLRRLVDFGAAAGSRPITWLVDPAVVDAAHALDQGNPPRSLASTVAPTGAPEPTGSPSAEPDEGGEATPPSGLDPDLPAAADAAGTWLARLREGLRGSQVLSLPYGDLDVAAAAEIAPDLYSRSRNRTSTQLADWGVSTSPAVAPPGGFLSTAALELVGDDATVLISDDAVPGPTPSVARVDGATVVPTSSAAATGGPGPNDPRSLVAMRQRIVAEAAVRALSDPAQPLVLVLPRKFAPASSTGFFEGLDLDWLRLTTLADIAQRRGRAVDPAEIVYPRAEARRQLDAANFSSANALIDSGESLQRVLSENKQIAGEVTGEALTDVSYTSRRRPNAARSSADRSRSWIDAQLASVRVDAPRAVTLSSEEGRFAATLTNGLDHPATVRIEAVTDGPLTISGPTRVEIGPGARTTVLLNATTTALGVNNVTLVVTDLAGNPLGSTDTVPIRSAQVSRAIWLILGTGIGLLFTAIGVRLVRRVRSRAGAGTR
ncbi:DUF6049 family protein [Nocardioides sp.]|uniref:DUF6049 family protein n=1 Tax=Nocardioides sp. TaxID=35761 RepID=UPI003563E11B